MALRSQRLSPCWLSCFSGEALPLLPHAKKKNCLYIFLIFRSTKAGENKVFIIFLAKQNSTSIRVFLKQMFSVTVPRSFTEHLPVASLYSRCFILLCFFCFCFVLKEAINAAPEPKQRGEKTNKHGKLFLAEGQRDRWFAGAVVSAAAPQPRGCGFHSDLRPSSSFLCLLRGLLHSVSASCHSGWLPSWQLNTHSQDLNIGLPELVLRLCRANTSPRCGTAARKGTRRTNESTIKSIWDGMKPYPKLYLFIFLYFTPGAVHGGVPQVAVARRDHTVAPLHAALLSGE